MLLLFVTDQYTYNIYINIYKYIFIYNIYNINVHTYIYYCLLECLNLVIENTNVEVAEFLNLYTYLTFC